MLKCYRYLDWALIKVLTVLSNQTVRRNIAYIAKEAGISRVLCTKTLELLMDISEILGGDKVMYEETKYERFWKLVRSVR